MTLWHWAPTNTSTTELLYPVLRNHNGRMGRKTVKARGTNICWETLSSRNFRDATSMKSQQRGYIRKTWTRFTPIRMLTSEGEISWGLIPKPSNKGNLRLLRQGKIFLLKEELPIDYPTPDDQAWKCIQKCNTIQVVFTYLGIYILTHTHRC